MKRFLPDFSAHQVPQHVADHERRQLKWFLAIVTILLVINVITNVILSWYGNPSVSDKHNPLIQPTPKPTISMPVTMKASPTIIISPTKKASASPTILPTKKPLATPTLEVKACPLDAKLCPDGHTYVGRGGPKCEFLPCPK